MNRIQTLGNEVKAQEVSAVLERDGCVIVRNLIEPRAITTLRAELAPYLEAQPPSPIYGGAAQGKGISDSAEFLGFKTTRTSALMAKSRTARTLAVLPLVLGCATSCSCRIVATTSLTLRKQFESDRVRSRRCYIATMVSTRLHIHTLTLFWR